LVDAETGQRGFIFTGKQEFLEPYTKATKRLEKTRTELAEQIKDNPEQLNRLAKIE
jgi:CHASE3 domain sensor protein